MLIHFATSFDTPVVHVTLVTWLLTDPPCCHTLIVEVYVLPSKKPILEYLGDGNWKINLKMKSNIPTSANYTNVIRDLALSSSIVDHTGDIVTMTWKVFNEANTLTR